MTQDYRYNYSTYPATASDTSTESAFKRYKSFPTPKDVYDSVLRGLKKTYPLTGEPIEVSDFDRYLESAVTDIEMALSCYLSEVVLYHSEPMIENMFGSNWGGINLLSWPATRVVSVQLKYGHTNLQTLTTGMYDPTVIQDPNFPGAAYQTYTYPREWIMLKRNKVNILPSSGSIAGSTDNSGFSGGAGGLYPFGGGGFNMGQWRPGAIEVVYQAGFCQDQLPSSVWDLIVTWASYYALMDLLPLLFPVSSVSDSIDGVSQGASIIVPQYLAARLDGLDKKRHELANNFKKHFGRSVAFTHMGS